MSLRERMGSSRHGDLVCAVLCSVVLRRRGCGWVGRLPRDYAFYYSLFCVKPERKGNDSNLLGLWMWDTDEEVDVDGRKGGDNNGITGGD